MASFAHLADPQASWVGLSGGLAEHGARTVNHQHAQMTITTLTCRRDERPWGSSVPPATWYQFSPNRMGQHPKDHLAKYQGWMHADGYAGFEDLYRPGSIRDVACMAHVRRKFVDIHRAQGSAIADEAIGRIAQLYAVEKGARGSPPEKWINKKSDSSIPRILMSGIEYFWIVGAVPPRLKDLA